MVETLAEDSIVFHQLHKRVWPSTQRETLFCSHLCQLTNAPCPENMAGHTWMVCNFSMEHDKVPVRSLFIHSLFVFFPVGNLSVYVIVFVLSR